VPPVAVTHILHNADPIPQGICTGFCSLCVRTGYALETKCHLGKTIIFNTIEKLGWKVDVRKHIVNEVVHMLERNDVEWEEGREVPLAYAEVNCTDCHGWKFGNFKHH
jgi:lipase ATG15